MSIMIYGLHADPMPAGYVPLEAITVLKCLDDEGDVVIVSRATSGLKVWDHVGLLTVALDAFRQDARAMWRADDSTDDG